VIDEKTMEDLIAADPEYYLREPGLELIGRQVTIGPYRFDLLFRDRTGARLIVEIQKGTLDRTHTYKILDYYEAYKELHPDEFVEVMVVANTIPAERKQRLDSKGIDYREVPVARFLDRAADKSGSKRGPKEATPLTADSGLVKASSPRIRGPAGSSAAFKLFIEQQALLSKALLEVDPHTWFQLLRGNFKEAHRGNWFICFVPSSWGRWRGGTYGVHFDFVYARARQGLPQRFRLAVGVESPLRRERWQKFKEDVIDRARARGIDQTGFVLRAKERTKLLEADPIPFDGQAWRATMERYAALEPVIAIIADLINEYYRAGAFAVDMEFVH
jgi:hypothetical protein